MNTAEMPAHLHKYVVIRPYRTSGTYAWVEQPGLNPSAPEVQQLAYGLLAAGWTWKQAMFGGFVCPENFIGTDVDGRTISGGGDGRWFASSVDVVDAADAWRIANDLPNWRKARRRRES